MGKKKKVANTEVWRIRVEKSEIKRKGKYGQGTAYDSGLSHIEITLLYYSIYLMCVAKN